MERGPPLLVRMLPRRALSRVTGFCARRRLPGFILRPLLRLYARRYGARLEEAALPLTSYASFMAFFTRALSPGARPWPQEALTIGCPCDGRVSQTGTVEQGTLLQVKDARYGLGELLGDPQAAASFEGGTYAVLYLAPGDYHRFHWPCDGVVHSVRHIRGDLWPVNERSVASVPRLFARNERVVCLGEVAGAGRFALVPVGALNVGSIRLAFHEVRTNRRGPVKDAALPLHAAGRRGEEFGWFELGSTVVLALARGAGAITCPAPGASVRLGQPFGSLRSSSNQG